ncbi:hypothetical protein MGMO_15c00550 [Methyloglobulus morosus KoM1]|uniref:Uncharacterized protein n=1 Tax=Methyloglobulus morosus KoM1 TaxID=1116472 RepID=V5C0M6_9GAMM|nr:hypothetical protein MGMO_15c00550 [Methyloglobulus morosus KoM1]
MNVMEIDVGIGLVTSQIVDKVEKVTASMCPGHARQQPFGCNLKMNKDV